RPLEPVWGAVLEELRQSMGIRRAVRVVESTVATVPTVIGWLRPVILVPTCALTGLAPGHLRALLAHELGHVRRHDYLVNLMQALLECLLFYHPAVWWISTRIRQEREFCCDDLAAAACGDVLLYARALAELEHTREPAPMLALGANGSPLMQRIRRLVGNRGGERRRVPVLPGLLVLALAAAAPVTALAQQDPGEKLCPRCAAIVRGMLPDQDPQPEPPIRHLRRGTLPGRQDGARGLRGHVVDPSGAPLPGAVIVSTRDGENSASGLLSLRVLPQLGTDGLMELNTWIEKSDELAGRRIVVSDSDGRFEVRAIGDDGEMAQLHGVLRSEPAKTKEYRVIIVDENGRRAHSLEGEIDDPENPGEIDAFMEFEFDDEDSADPETMDLLLHTAAESGDGEVKVKVIRKGMQAPRAGERTYDVRVADDSDETDGDGEHQVFEYRRHEGDGEPFGDLLAIDVDENGEAGQRYGFLRRRLGAAAPGRYFLRWEQDGGEENAAIDVHRNGGVERLILRPGETFDPQSLLLRSPELRRTLMLGGQNLRGVRFRDAIEAPAECKAECCQPAEAAKVKVEAKKRGSIYL
ncbi:MAG TPA: M56 family metallopeptidase, partial [Steroidobacteraceae bacterium]